MPDPKAFLKGFKVARGLVIGNWKITSVEIGHIMIKRYQEYEFPITIVATNSSKIETKENLTLNKFMYQFQKYVDQNKGVIVNSRYGNPYKCVFGSLTESKDRPLDYPKSVILSATGNAIRVPKV
jgi:hypothetical protein